MAGGRDIIVIGASGGGIEALRQLVSQFPVGLAAAVIVVQHTGAHSPGVLGDILTRAGPLPARMASGSEPIAMGQIRVAPADHHLVVTADGLRLDHGPVENWVRPAIDVLFRSAAVAFGPRVVGVVLTGSLSDGAAGLRAIKDCGGMTMVQSPDEAAFPDMPRNAIRYVSPDFVGGLDELAAKLVEVVGQQAPPSASASTSTTPMHPRR
jgi:two-component system chemotaxis response regulator CheB